MKTYGLIGFPLTQSFSQKFFSQKFEDESIDAQYLNFEIPSIKDFPEIIKNNPHIAGLNVTIPYKEEVMQYLDELDPTAKEAGAVNVVKTDWSNPDKPKLIGYNSDIIGFKRSLLPFLREEHDKALILGTGGAAKAVAYTLRTLGISYKFVSRTPKSQNDFSYADLNQPIMNAYKLIINTTPLGMFPNIDGKPDLPYEHCGKFHLFYDLVYNPEVTQFLQEGLNVGTTIKNGLEMLHLQAKAAYEIWNK